MNELENWISKLNKQQKLIIAVVFPVVLFIIAITIADNVAQSNNYYPGNPFKFHVTWWVWLIFVVSVGAIEYKLFGRE